MHSGSLRTLYVCLVALGVLGPCRVAGADNITLSWDPNLEPVAGYILHVGTHPGTYTRNIDVGPSNTFTFPDAIAGQQYCFVVTAYAYPSLESAPSNEVCTSPPWTSPSPSPSPSPSTGEYFELVSRNSGKCLDVAGGLIEAGTPVIQWTCHGGPNQQWRLEQAGGGAVRIVSRYSGQVLDVTGGLVDDEARIIQWPAHGGDNQAWTLENASDGYVLLIGRQSGKAIDIAFGSTDDGAAVIQYAPHFGANQQWLLRAVQ